MAETENQAANAVAASETPTKAKKEKKTGGKAKAPKAKPNHPPTSEMVNNAIKALKERGGSSLQAIKKYIAANYKVDAEKVSPFIKKYLKSAVVSGSLVQTKGKGASGSFKLAGSEGGAKKKTAAAKKPTGAAKSKAVKPKSPKKAAASKAKKSPAEKKEKTEAKKAAAPKKEAPAKKAPKSPKAKKSAKSPIKKPKAPKPKTTKTAAKPKKAAPKKK